MMRMSEKRLIERAEKNIKNKTYSFTSERFTNRFFHEVMPDGSWENKACFIVGGGPSLANFNWSLLKGKRTIGINRVYEKIDPTIIFSMDTRFLRWILEGKYGEVIKERFISSKAYKVWLCTYTCILPIEIFIMRVYESYSKGFRAFPLSMKDGLGHGNNSGYGALNLAVCLGANPIYLLGFDMKFKLDEETKKLDEQMKKIGKRVRTHWHNGHPNPMRPHVLENFIKYFRVPAKICKEQGIEVINLCPDSALPYFPKKRVEEVLS